MNKRSRLGSTDVDVTNYWTEGKNGQELRCNETVIYAEIDDCQSDVLIAKTTEDVQRAYGRMDMFWLCLQAINLYALDEVKLYHAGVVIGNFVYDGRLSLSFPTVEAENAYIVSLLEELKGRVENYGEVTINRNFTDWYDENVMQLNYYRNTDGTITKDRPSVDGLAATSTSDEWSIKMKEAGTYLLYHVSDTSKENMDRNAVSRKKAEQSKLLNWLHNSSNNMTRNSILANARSGIKTKTGMSEQEALALMGDQARKGVKGLGELATIIGLVLLAILLICSVVEAVMAAKYQNEINAAARDALNDYSPTQANIKGSAPENDDFLKAAAALLADDEDYAPLLWIGGFLVAGLAVAGIAAAKKKKAKKEPKDGNK